MIDLYREPAVCERIREFVGPPDGKRGGAVAIRSDGCTASRCESELPSLLNGSAEIERSLWDHSRIIADLDIEYVNQDYPGESFLDPHRCFALQRPVVEAIQELLAELGVFPLHLMSGRGHHLVWSIAKSSEGARRLREAGLPWALAEGGSAPAGSCGRVSTGLEQAFVGLGMSLEWLAHRVVAQAAGCTPISIQITDVRVGSGRRGRECISIDLSEYGDPLCTRYLRVPYTYYRKPSRRPDVFGDHVAARTPDLVSIPVFEMSDREGIEVMRDPAAAAKLARRAPAKIPDASDGTARLAEAYRGSDLAHFHRRYYAAGARRAEAAPPSLPPCAAKILERPNDLLLQPAGIQHLVRILLAFGWAPRDVAKLIQGKFEEDHGWGARWETYDPARRADFYTRLFAGAIACQSDRLVDLNSVSHIEKGCCSPAECACDLSVFRRSLEERVIHERLGRRPFNRLLLA